MELEVEKNQEKRHNALKIKRSSALLRIDLEHVRSKEWGFFAQSCSSYKLIIYTLNKNDSSFKELSLINLSAPYQSLCVTIFLFLNF